MKSISMNTRIKTRRRLQLAAKAVASRISAVAVEPGDAKYQMLVNLGIISAVPSTPTPPTDTSANTNTNANTTGSDASSQNKEWNENGSFTNGKIEEW